MTEAQKEMVAWIHADNARWQAWVEKDPENRWAPPLTDDVEHWERYGIRDVDALLDYLDECAKED